MDISAYIFAIWAFFWCVNLSGRLWSCERQIERMRDDIGRLRKQLEGK